MFFLPTLRLRLPALARIAFLSFCLACGACSTLNLEAARALSATGQEAAVKIKAAAFASDTEYSRAMDAEALFHGAARNEGSELYKQLKASYAAVNNEIAKRAQVVAALADFYEAFGELAKYDASGETQAALTGLGTAIDSYRKDVLNAGPLSQDTVGLVVHVGGLIAAERQKEMVRQASAAVRPKLTAFHDALASPLVKDQFTGFKKTLASDRAAAVIYLWKQGLLDASPLVGELAADGGLTPVKNAAEVVLKSVELSAAMQAVIARRVNGKLVAIERSYDTSVQLLADLVAEHRKLEEGAPLDLARVRALVAELTAIVNLVNKI